MKNIFANSALIKCLLGQDFGSKQRGWVHKKGFCITLITY